jgi:tetratricopeptide (TPR) repeat protein
MLLKIDSGTQLHCRIMDLVRQNSIATRLDLLQMPSMSSKIATSLIFLGYFACLSALLPTPAAAETGDVALIGPASQRTEREKDAAVESGDLPETDSWTREYNSGLKALQNRMYAEAEQKLLAAVKDAKKGASGDQRLILARTALADVYTGLEKYDEAEKLYSWAYQAARKGGEETEIFGKAAHGLALVNYLHGNHEKAATICKQAIVARRKSLGATHHDVGQSYVLMAVILGKQNYPDEAEPYLTRGLHFLEKSPGPKQLDYADALRTAAQYKQSRGQKKEAEQLFEKSYAITDGAVAFDQPANLKGSVVYKWEAGSPRALEIPDYDFPLRYININGVRVAATIIDLWELMGILISITNTNDERVVLGLDKVNLEQLSLDLNNTSRHPLTFVDANSIDRIRRERVMWDLTMNRPWLANIQKTRNVRGLVPQQGHDLFRGPNIFGVYGDWGAIPRVMPGRLESQASPERVQYQMESKLDSGLVNSNTVKMTGLVPVSLEPFESRTGELFYIHPRCESVLLTVRVGNTTVQLPFKLRKRRIN